jgi:hypothetical protein
MQQEVGRTSWSKTGVLAGLIGLSQTKQLGSVIEIYASGVGGSIPSLATIVSTAYKASLRQIHSKAMARDDSPRLECWIVAEWLPSRCAAG